MAKKKQKQEENWEKSSIDEVLDLAKKADAKLDKLSKKKARPKNKMIKEVIEKPRDDLEKRAQKIALELATRQELVATEELSPTQEKAATLYGQGFMKDEICEFLSLELPTLNTWLKQPNFIRRFTEVTTKEGLSEKSERIRASKRRLQWLTEAFFKKGEETIQELGVTTLFKMLQEANKEMSELVDDKKEDNTKKDISIMIINHVRDKNGKHYDNIDEFLSERKFPTIDVETIDDNLGIQ